jgi:hypothetical protein
MQFYDQQLVDFRGDIRLRVKVWMGSVFAPDHTQLDPSYECLGEFPLDFAAQYNDGILQASIANGRLSLSLLLRQELPWIVTSNGKPGSRRGASTRRPISHHGIPAAPYDRFQFTISEKG